MEKEEFSDTLARVKSIPGRRWNPDSKTWEFPADADTALRIMAMIEPVADAEIKALVAEHTAEVAEALVTEIGEDAELAVDPVNHEGHHLRPYQRAAVDYIMRHPHTIVADEMGLGKTVTGITAVLEADARYDAGTGGPFTEEHRHLPVAIVAPNAMIGTWLEEIMDWAGVPEERIVTVDGRTPGKRAEQMALDADWFILNWEKLQPRVKLIELLRKRKWKAIIADEAHRMKNKDAQQTKSIHRLTAPILLPMTGTPIMAHPGELWSLLHWLRPEQYTGYWPFHYSYVDEYKTKYGAVITGVRNVDQLRFELADKLIRRTKKDVLKDLPEKLPRRFIKVEMKPKQRKLYEAAENDFLLDIKDVLTKDELDPAQRESILEALEANDIKRLTYLLPNGAARTMRLRQIASTPAILGGPDDSAKMDAAAEIVADNPGKPFVIFTWFKPSAEIMAERLRKLPAPRKGHPKLKVGVIAGDADATAIKNQFQDGDLDIVVATIAKGGAGLTLTRADTAIFIERDWTPALNEQAEDRLHRMGQKNPVQIIVLEARGTVDTGRIAKANRLKELIADQVLGKR